MGKALRAPSIVARPPLVIGLADPGMTPLLRAGLGGLAASLHAILRERSPALPWPSPIPIGPGTATVEAHRLCLMWGDKDPAKTLKALFDASFRVRKPEGIIELPGTWAGGPPGIALAIALQVGLKRTFLQHGKVTSKVSSSKTVSVEIDGRTLPFDYQPYKGFVHQDAWKRIGAGLKDQRRAIPLAGWAYPGAAQRHIGFRSTSWLYTPPEALCACFAIVGCVSYPVPRISGGALVIVEPVDLVQFAAVRSQLTPRRAPEAYMSGVGDAVLAVNLALRMDAPAQRRGVASTHGILLRATPWAPQQKSRVLALSLGAVPDSTLDRYETVVRTLPSSIRPTLGHSKTAEEEPVERGSFPATSVLRGFITENIAAGAPWYKGFATATTGSKKPRFIHYYRDPEGRGLGALYPDDRRGLIAMLDHLEDFEKSLVRSVHVALRQRFGAIARESVGNPATMKNRFRNERDKWRLAFAGSKTPDQIRAALADLWSRAGSNRELRANWEQILPLLQPTRWQTARDLALIALASYQGEEKDDTAETNEVAAGSSSNG